MINSSKLLTREDTQVMFFSRSLAGMTRNMRDLNNSWKIFRKMRMNLVVSVVAGGQGNVRYLSVAVIFQDPLKEELIHESLS